MGSWKDRLGILASVVCAIHCAATPILIASLPTLKLTEWMAGPAFHQWAAAICIGLVAIAILPSFLKSWDYRVLGLSLSGIGLIVTAAFFMPDTCCTQPLAAAGMMSSGTSTEPPSQSHGHDDHGHDAHGREDHGHDHEGHNHAGHSHAGAGHHHADGEDAHGSDAAMVSIAGVQPWLTPLGGMLLILAHALNLKHRRRDLAACCPAPSHLDGYLPERLRACNVGMEGEREYAQAS